MTTIGMPRGGLQPTARPRRMAMVLRETLLVCGVVSSLLYVTMNVVVALRWQGYSAASQTVSELSAIGAPTRTLWVELAIPYTLLAIAFGWGVWRSSGNNGALRTAGGILLIYALLGLLWPFAPMHDRLTLAAGGGTLTDIMHIALGCVTVALMLLAIGFGATALGARFRRYSIATLVVVFVFGLLVGIGAPDLSAGRPTPWLGVWERIDIAALLLWVAVLAIALMHFPATASHRAVSHR